MTGADILTYDDIEGRVRQEDATLLPGWVIVPCDAASKHPTFNRWQTVTANSPTARAAMATRIRHDAWSLLCGPSGVYVVDLDEKPGESGSAEWLALMERETSEWRPSIVGETPSGGRHLYYAPPTSDYVGRNSSRLRPGIDTRGDGGQVVLAGPGRTLTIRSWTLPAVPGAWLEVIKRPEPLQRVPTRPGGAERDDVAIGRVRRGLLAAADLVANSAEGKRNAVLNWAAYKAGRDAIATGWSAEAVADILLDAALEAGLGTDEATKTIRSGLGR